jgi:hypothetical protein
MTQRLIDFDIGKLVNQAIHDHIRRRENYRFSRVKFDIDLLINFIRRDDETDDIDEVIQIIIDYESFSHVGAFFGDRELGILGFLMKEKFDHLTRARFYMADLIFKNPYLSKKQRETHPHKLIVLRKKMFLSLMGSIFDYLKRHIFDGVLTVGRVLNLFQKIANFKCTAKFDWTRRLQELEREFLTSKSLKAESISQSGWEILSMIFSTYCEVAEDAIPPLRLTSSEHHKTNSNYLFSLSEKYFDVCIDPFYSDEHPDTKRYTWMLDIMELIASDDKLIALVARNYIQRRPDRYPMRHMQVYDCEWLAKFRAALPGNSILSEFLASLGIDIDEMVVAEIIKLRKIQQMCSDPNPEIQKRLRELYCMLSIAEALKIIDTDSDGHRALEELIVCYIEQSSANTELGFITENIRDIYEISVERDYHHPDTISLLFSLKSRYESTIQEHIYRIFRIKENSRSYFIRNLLIGPEDIFKMRFVNPAVIDLFGEFGTVQNILSIYQHMKKITIVDDTLLTVFSKYIKVHCEDAIMKAIDENNDRLKETSSTDTVINFTARMGVMLIDSLIRNRYVKSNKVDELVLYAIQTRDYVLDQLNNMDGYSIRTIVRHQLPQSIEYLASIGLLVYRDQRFELSSSSSSSPSPSSSPSSSKYEYDYDYSDIEREGTLKYY